MIVVVDFKDEDGIHYRAVAYNGTLEILDRRTGFWSR